MGKLRIVFFGSPAFAVPSLEVLIRDGYPLAAVVTAPDRPAGRGLRLEETEVKRSASLYGIPVLQPLNLKEEGFLESLRSLRPDLFIVVAFRMLPEAVWKMPSAGTVNLHASLLPNYRGAAPINWAIINGERETGLTTFFINEKIDTGDLLYSEKIKIGRDENAGSLHDRMMVAGASLLLRTVRDLEKGSFLRRPQTETAGDLPLLMQAPKITRDTCRIRWDKQVVDIHNLVRGLSPLPAAFTELSAGGTPAMLKIFTSSPEPDYTPGLPGTILTDHKSFLKVACRDGYLHLLSVQTAGRKKMEIKEFLKGTSFRNGCQMQ